MPPPLLHPAPAPSGPASLRVSLSSVISSSRVRFPPPRGPLATRVHSWDRGNAPLASPFPSPDSPHPRLRLWPSLSSFSPSDSPTVFSRLDRSLSSSRPERTRVVRQLPRRSTVLTLYINTASSSRERERADFPPLPLHGLPDGSTSSSLLSPPVGTEPRSVPDWYSGRHKLLRHCHAWPEVRSRIASNFAETKIHLFPYSLNRNNPLAEYIMQSI